MADLENKSAVNHQVICIIVILLMFFLSCCSSQAPTETIQATIKIAKIVDKDTQRPIQSNIVTFRWETLEGTVIKTETYKNKTQLLVFYNGSDDLSYRAIDLDTYSTDAAGYFVVCGNAANVANCDLDASPDTDLIQNGADAAALYTGSAADFPTGTALTTANLVDALVYDTDDADDAGLLVLLNAGQPQVNENGGGNKDTQSNQRCPNGRGGARNTDAYTQQLPTPGQENNCPVDPGFGVCGDPATFIHDVQGSGMSSPLVGQKKVIEGLVIGDFQDTTTGLSGYFLQEEELDFDADASTSEGIFVYDNGFSVDVDMGQRVRVMGEVAEYYDLTELRNITNQVICSPDPFATYTTQMTLPVASLGEWEKVEGMYVQINQTLYVTDTYDVGRYGEVELSVGDRLYAPTSITAPGTKALMLQDENDRSRIQLDDGSNVQNPTPYPPYFGQDDTLRVGDTTYGLNGAVSYSFGAYEIQPSYPVMIIRANERQSTIRVVPGALKVVGMNVLNYFTTLDTGAPVCGPSGNLGCRGANTAEELVRQRDKLTSAILTLDADILGLTEIENNAATTIQDLVDWLNKNAGSGTYAYINTGTIGTDAIKVAFLYKPARVMPVGPYKILDSSVDPNFLDAKNRPSLAQTFQSASGEKFTVAVNHFKSKGSSCDDVGDPDLNDGQGNCNLTRTKAATALSNWLAADPTGSADPDFLIIGDLNSYALEDPITALKSAGYTNLVDAFSGAFAHSYLFEGQSGYLDHALANASLVGKIRFVYEWHINADEPRALDYNDYNQPALYHPDPYRAADHDPIVVYISDGKLNYLPVVNK